MESLTNSMINSFNPNSENELFNPTFNSFGCESFIDFQPNTIILNNSININSSKEKAQIINEISDLIKCYICLDKIKNPKMCHFCHRLVCDECIRKWLDQKNTCGFCRHRITRFDFIDVPFMSNIKLLLDYNKNLEEKKVDLEKENKELNIKLNNNKCNKHNEKILYYCINCNQKLCGKCTAFNNKEAKIHEKHKVFEYSEIEKSKYNDIINLLENSQEQIKEIDKNIKKCEDIAINNKTKLEKEKILLNIIYKEIENNYLIKNEIHLNNLKALNNIQKVFDEKCKYLKNELCKIESLEKPINNFNIEKQKNDFEKYKNKLLKVEEKMNEDNNNIFIELKSFNYTFYKTYESIIKEKSIKITINNPIKIYFSLELNEKDLLEINFPISLYITDNNNSLNNMKKKKINIFPLLQINNQIYTEFKKEKKSILFESDKENNIFINGNNKIEDEEEKEIKNLVNIIEANQKGDKNKIIENKNIIKAKEKEKEDENDNLEYRLLIKLKELINGNNKFELFIYYFSSYN